MSVAIDAMVLIWGLQKPHHKGKKATNQDVADMRRRAKLLLRTLAEAKETVVVPAIVVSEVLLGIRPAEHGEFIAALQEHFFMPPFDVRAASLAAQLWLETRELPKEQQPARTTLKADVLIVATAKVAGAEVFYSHDGNFRKLAGRAGMRGEDLPTHSENLFIDAEARREAEEEERAGPNH